jgi:uncharacterized protein
MIRQDKFSLTGSANKIIHGDITYDDANPTLPLVIFVHGFKGFKDWGAHNLVARHFAQNGFRYLKFNLSHNGVNEQEPQEVTDLDSFASNTISKELYDVRQVINFACDKENFNAINNVYLIGHSRGGALSIIEASQDPNVDKLATWGAISDFNSLWKPEQTDQWRKEKVIHVENARTKEQMPVNSTMLEDLEQNAEIYDIEAAAKKLNIPWLIIHGDADVNVNVSVARRLNEIQLNARLLILEGADHVFGAKHPYTENILPPDLLAACEATIAFFRTNG